MTLVTPPDTMTLISGIRIGHWTDTHAATGCTVLLNPEGTVGAVDVRGGAPGTRETDLLRPGGLVGHVDALLLTGGSAFGLDAAAGVMRYLEEIGVGFPTAGANVPIVSAAVIHDLTIGRGDRRPGGDEGYTAARSASDHPPSQGSVGAGTGATVAKVLGLGRAVKGGLGTATERLSNGLAVTAIAVVNCFGEIVDPSTGTVVAGPLDGMGSFACTRELLRNGEFPKSDSGPSNSTIGAVITDATLDGVQCQRLAMMAHTGLTRVIQPAHTQLDGDTIFALATGEREISADLTALGTIAAHALERAILIGVRRATGLAGVPAVRELNEEGFLTA